MPPSILNLPELAILELIDVPSLQLSKPYRIYLLQEEDEECYYWGNTINQRRLFPMSIAIVMVGIDGMVLATDSREMRVVDNTEYPVDNVHKLETLTESK